MKIYKFGGASLKTANAVKNMTEIVCNNIDGPLVIIVSAMGKTTNALEAILEEKRNGNNVGERLKLLEKYHLDICNDLFEEKELSIKADLDAIFVDLIRVLEHDISGIEDALYDKVVSFGEILSSSIIAAYLNKRNVNCALLDARELIVTDNSFKEGKVQWEHTNSKIRKAIRPNNDSKAEV